MTAETKPITRLRLIAWAARRTTFWALCFAVSLPISAAEMFLESVSDWASRGANWIEEWHRRCWRAVQIAFSDNDPVAQWALLKNECVEGKRRVEELEAANTKLREEIGDQIHQLDEFAAEVRRLESKEAFAGRSADLAELSALAKKHEEGCPF